MPIQKEFAGDEDYGLRSVQDEQLDDLTGEIVVACRDRYIRACLILQHYPVFYERIRHLKEYHLKAVVDIYHCIAAAHRFEYFRYNHETVYTLYALTPEGRKKLCFWWERFFFKHLETLIDSPEFVSSVVFALLNYPDKVSKFHRALAMRSLMDYYRDHVFGNDSFIRAARRFRLRSIEFSTMAAQNFD